MRQHTRPPGWECPYCHQEITKDENGREQGHEGWCGGSGGGTG